MKGTRSTSVLALLLWCCSCQTSEPPRAASARAVPPQTSCKPEAPIAVEITTRAIGPGELEVIARATPTRDVPAIELSLALPSHATASASEMRFGATHAGDARMTSASQVRFGATHAGDARVMSARVRADQRTSQLSAIARVDVEGVVMARTATIAIGAPAPAQRVTTYALPDGDLAREVQP